MGRSDKVDLRYAVLARKMAQNLAVAVFEAERFGIVIHFIMKQFCNFRNQHTRGRLMMAPLFGGIHMQSSLSYTIGNCAKPTSPFCYV
jgi:hypothetical protein